MKGALKLRKLLLRLNDRVLIVTHKHADIDALASAVALSELLTRLSAGLEVVLFIPEGVSRDARRVYLRIYGRGVYEREKIVSRPSLNHSYIIIVDAASPSQIPGIESLLAGKESLLIDHHAKNSLKDMVDHSFVYRDAMSSSEIVASVFRSRELSRPISCLLMAGVLTDTSRLRRGTPMTFQALSMLSKHCDYSSVQQLLFAEDGRDVRIARLRAMQRMIIAESNGLLIAGTHVGSYESDVASQLTRIGADIAIVVSPGRRETRVVIRARRGRAEALSSLVLGAIEGYFSVKGGGHPGAYVVEAPRVYQKRHLPGLVKKLVELSLRAAGKG